MPEYNCECCNFKTKLKSHFERHLTTKKHMNVSKMYPNVSLMYPNVSKTKTTGFPCKYCGKVFKYHTGVSKHIKYACKQNKDEDIKELVRLLNEQNKEKDSQITRILKQNEKMQRQIEQLSKKLQVQSIGTMNNTQNNSNIVNYNFKILNYKDTDYSHLTERDYVKCINDCNHCVKTLIERVHFNNTKPENMNLYIPSMKDNYIMVYDDNGWKIQDRKEILDDLYDKNEWTLESWYEEYKVKYPDMVVSFERYLKNKEEDDVVNDVKRKILMQLYNKRNIIMDNRKQSFEMENK